MTTGTLGNWSLLVGWASLVQQTIPSATICGLGQTRDRLAGYLDGDEATMALAVNMRLAPLTDLVPTLNRFAGGAAQQKVDEYLPDHLRDQLNRQAERLRQIIQVHGITDCARNLSSEGPPDIVPLSRDEDVGLSNLARARRMSVEKKINAEKEFILSKKVDVALFDRAVSPEGTWEDKARVILIALREDYKESRYKLNTGNAHVATLIETLRSSTPLKEAALGLMQPHTEFDLLIMPLSPRLWVIT